MLALSVYLTGTVRGMQSACEGVCLELDIKLAAFARKHVYFKKIFSLYIFYLYVA